MNDRDILRHDRLDRVCTFGSENHADLPDGCEAIPRFANLAILSAKLARHKVGQLRSPASLQTQLDALSSDFKDIARTARAIDLDQPGFAAFYRHPAEPTASNLKTHADSLLARLENAPTDTPAQLAEKAALRAQFIAKLIPADFVHDLRADRDAIDGKNLIAVGTAVAGGPPHRSVREELPHTALVLSQTRVNSEESLHVYQACYLFYLIPVLCPG